MVHWIGRSWRNANRWPPRVWSAGLTAGCRRCLWRSGRQRIYSSVRTFPIDDLRKNATYWQVGLKTTEYFRYTKTRPDRARILEEWIERAIEHPIREQRQSDGRIRRWAYVDSEGKYLRVVVLDDGETVHNAFFDRDFKP